MLGPMHLEHFLPQGGPPQMLTEWINCMHWPPKMTVSPQVLSVAMLSNTGKSPLRISLSYFKKGILVTPFTHDFWSWRQYHIYFIVSMKTLPRFSLYWNLQKHWMMRSFLCSCSPFIIPQELFAFFKERLFGRQELFLDEQWQIIFLMMGQ